MAFTEHFLLKPSDNGEKQFESLARTVQIVNKMSTQLISEITILDRPNRRTAS